MPPCRLVRLASRLPPAPPPLLSSSVGPRPYPCPVSTTAAASPASARCRQRRGAPARGNLSIHVDCYDASSSKSRCTEVVLMDVASKPLLII
ncbi:hypothetical protein E2562_006992 [Oryza meyeriana var. granulata]|uniref:Uncharacterized protein n=1 Tax=Oryza meyeriana var. granulata TaxID=110450 RepID=A0A6G1EA18_9ORYZ|nr:hypothetical protein E2562_006992 [Oryza meyeriana var. granulata]